MNQRDKFKYPMKKGAVLSLYLKGRIFLNLFKVDEAKRLIRPNLMIITIKTDRELIMSYIFYI